MLFSVGGAIQVTACVLIMQRFFTSVFLPKVEHNKVSFVIFFTVNSCRSEILSADGTNTMILFKNCGSVSVFQFTDLALTHWCNHAQEYLAVAN